MMGQINKYRIADLVLEVEGDPDYIAPEFKSFQCDVSRRSWVSIHMLDGEIVGNACRTRVHT